MQVLTISLSVAAFLLAVYNVWLTNLRRGRLRLTKPAQFYFGPDRGGMVKVFFRGLLWSTGAQGHTIEHMFLRLRRDSLLQTFPIWVYGERDSLALGSGVRILNQGLACNHHFLLHNRDAAFQFVEGAYTVEVWATTANAKTPERLCSTVLVVSSNEAKQIAKGRGLYFDWSPDGHRYVPHVDDKEPPMLPAEVLRLLETALQPSN